MLILMMILFPQSKSKCCSYQPVTEPTIAAITSTIYSLVGGVAEEVGANDVSDDVLMVGLMEAIEMEGAIVVSVSV